MAPPNWAYQADNFSPSPDEELICSICRCVFSDPVQSPCNHVFCRSCIIKWLENNRNCPICRKRTTRYSLQEVLPLIKNMIMKLTLHCHNREKGCEDKFPLESCETHIRDCIYETVRCKNRPCKEMILRKDKEDHEQNNCPHRYVKCKTCSMKISSNTSGVHNCIVALKKQLKLKNELIQKKVKKIKELQQQVKNLQDAQRAEDSSDSSSLESISAADIMINLSSMSPASSPDSFISYSSGEDRAEDNDPSFWISTSEILNGLESNYNRMREGNSFQDDQAFQAGVADDSVEYPRQATAANDSSVVVVDSLDSSPDLEPQPRRPAKRPVRALNFSDEDDDAMDVNPIPSPKRHWRLFRSSTDTHSSAESPEGATTAAAARPSTSNAEAATCSSNPAPTQRPPIRFRPKLRQRPRADPAAATTSTPASGGNGSTMFKRTLSLLERSNLESEPEWMQNSENADYVLSDSTSDSDYMPPPRMPTVSVSEDSSSSDSSSSDSSIELTRKRSDIFNGLYNSSSSEDPDWMPH